MLKQIFHVLFNIKWLKFNHTHNIVPVNLHLSISVNGVSKCLSECAIW